MMKITKLTIVRCADELLSRHERITQVAVQKVIEESLGNEYIPY